MRWFLTVFYSHARLCFPTIHFSLRECLSLQHARLAARPGLQSLHTKWGIAMTAFITGSLNSDTVTLKGGSMDSSTRYSQIIRACVSSPRHNKNWWSSDKTTMSHTSYMEGILNFFGKMYIIWRLSVANHKCSTCEFLNLIALNIGCQCFSNFEFHSTILGVWDLILIHSYRHIKLHCMLSCLICL